MIDVRLLNHPIEFDALPEVPADCGAECVFLGRTRAETHPKHGPLARLSYEAYESLTIPVLENMAHEARDQWNCSMIRIHHAVGDVPIGKASVLVHVVAGHRAEAFEACRWLIDKLKSVAPIWKMEVWQDGTTWANGQPVAVDDVKGLTP